MKKYAILFILSATIFIGCSPKISGIHYYDGSVYAVTDDEALYAWGKNDKGQLGTGDKEFKDKPVKILDTIHVFEHYDLSYNGGDAGAILYHDGSVYAFDGQDFLAWGDNTDGRLGVGKGKEKEVLTPTKIELNEGSFLGKIFGDKSE